MDQVHRTVRDSAAEANQRHRPVQVGPEVVTRPAGSFTPTVHAFLRHLRTRGVDGVPDPVGCDGEVETLRVIEGESGGDGWRHQHAEEGLRSAARLLRRIHDASVDWTPARDATFGAPHHVDGEEDELVWCHGDPGPWNFVWRDGTAVGLIDWDFLHRGPRVDDIAYALLWFAPMRSDDQALDWHHFPAVPDRRARIATFLDAYGPLPAFDVVDAVVARRHRTIEHVRALAEQGVEPQRTWVDEGTVEDELDEIRWIVEHRHLF